jgi:N-acetylneuraminate lyase
MPRAFSIVAAAFTPFARDGVLDVSRIETQVAGLVRDGVHGAFVCGTTGEGAALTTAERRQVAEAWVAHAPAGFRVIVHVGHAATAEAAALAAHAQEIGAHAIAAVPPYFLKPRTAVEVAACLEPIAAAAPRLPFFHYHIPAVTGIAVSAAEVVRVALARIPNFAGIKFTDADLGDLGRALDALGDAHEAFFGRDDMLLPAMALGVRAAVGMSYNYTGPAVRALCAAFDAGDMGEARRHQRLLRDLLGACAPHGLINALKALAPLVGVDCGPCRPPLRTLADTEARAIVDALALQEALRLAPARP